MKMFNGKYDDARVYPVNDEAHVAALARGYYLTYWSRKFKSEFQLEFNREATFEERQEAFYSHISLPREKGTWPDMPEKVWELGIKDWEEKTGKDRSTLNFDP